jgi:hypothetical protein
MSLWENIDYVTEDLCQETLETGGVTNFEAFGDAIRFSLAKPTFINEHLPRDIKNLYSLL